jgi:hypothetical protein
VQPEESEASEVSEAFVEFAAPIIESFEHQALMGLQAPALEAVVGVEFAVWFAKVIAFAAMGAGFGIEFVSVSESVVVIVAVERWFSPSRKSPRSSP